MQFDCRGEMRRIIRDEVRQYTVDMRGDLWICRVADNMTPAWQTIAEALQ